MARDERTGAYARNVSQEDWDMAHKMSQLDGFGFGVKQLSEAQKTAKKMAVDHLYVWNRLIENKGPMGIQQDQQNSDPRLQQLLGDKGFMNFLNAKSMDDKMVALRDAGINNNMCMTDADLSQFLMTHVPIGLTEDKNVGNEAQRIVSNEKPSKFEEGMRKY